MPFEYFFYEATNAFRVAFILTQYADAADSTEERDKQDFFQKLYEIYCCARFLGANSLKYPGY